MSNLPILTPEIEKLLRLLDSDEPESIFTALQQLAKLGYTPVLPAFGRLLRHEDVEIQNAAINAILALLIGKSGAERGLIALKSADGKTFQPRAVQGIALSSWEQAGTGEIVNRVGQMGDPILTTNAQHDAHFHNSSSIISYSLRSVAAVPIHAGEEVIGVIYVDHPVRSGLISSEMYNTLINAGSAVGTGYDELPRPTTTPPPSWLSDLQKLDKSEDDSEMDTVPLRSELLGDGNALAAPREQSSQPPQPAPTEPPPSTPIREPIADTFTAFPPLTEDLVPLLRMGVEEEQDTVLTPPKTLRESGSDEAPSALDDEAVVMGSAEGAVRVGIDDDEEQIDGEDTVPLSLLEASRLFAEPEPEAEKQLDPPAQGFFPSQAPPAPDETSRLEIAQPTPAPTPAAADIPKPPAHDALSPDEMLRWMESLAKRQAAFENTNTGQPPKDAKPGASPAAPLVTPAPQPIPSPAPTAKPTEPPSTPASTTARNVEFAVYQPIDVAPEVWSPLTAYVYYADRAAVVEADARRLLAEQIEMLRRLSKPTHVPVREGALITATPRLPGFQFNPPSLSIAFYEPWHRFDFKLRAADAPQYQAANGQITFTVEGVIVCDVPLSVFVGDGIASSPARRSSAKAYQAIFCSYSRRDLPIIARVEKAYKALGLQYLRDLEVLRSGETWSDGLRKLIDEADIFQLFWSSHSAASDHVQMEWQHALALGRGEAFIRPVHWEMPMPPAPAELAHVHFTYAPELGEEQA